MAIAKEESLVYSIEGGQNLSNNNSSGSLPIGNADQYTFIVKCHRCNSEWIELWRTYKWFMQNNSYNKNSY
jgi:hypothetical protein